MRRVPFFGDVWELRDYVIREIRRGVSKYDHPVHAADQIENWMFADDYALPGHSVGSGPGIVIGKFNEQPIDRESIDETQRKRSWHARLLRIFAKLGFEIEWTCECDTCSDCGKVVVTSPDSAFWTPFFSILDGERFCETCIRKRHMDEYLWTYEGRARLIYMDVDLSQYGYKAWMEGLEDGHHEGQTQSLKLLAKYLRGLGFTRFLFKHVDSDMFHTAYSLWCAEDAWGEKPEIDMSQINRRNMSEIVKDAVAVFNQQTNECS